MTNHYSYDGAKAEREASSGKALLIRLASGATHWIPKSVIHDDSEVYQEGHEGRLVLAGWFADKEGLADVADDEGED